LQISVAINQLREFEPAFGVLAKVHNPIFEYLRVGDADVVAIKR